MLIKLALAPEAGRPCTQTLYHLPCLRPVAAACLQVLALLAEDKVTLFGFGNDEVELHPFSQHGGLKNAKAWREWRRTSAFAKSKGGRVSSQLASFQAAPLKMVTDRGQLS